MEISPNLKVVDIKPNCLRVDKATTCFISELVIAQYLPKNIVRSPVVIRRLLKGGYWESV